MTVVHWSHKARTRLLEIHAYMAKDSPQRAVQMVDRLTRRREHLAAEPRVDIVGPNMKTAKVFTQGNSQAVRLPKEFRVNADELFIEKSGDSIVLTPKGKARWKNLKAGMAMFRGTIERRQPKEESKD
ncbi:MAG: AbrB/MazE/SpoVT family DNA-binding domain-containing protein [Steroidobacteraceae bacterium]